VQSVRSDVEIGEKSIHLLATMLFSSYDLQHLIESIEYFWPPSIEKYIFYISNFHCDMYAPPNWYLFP